jgi:hypothetical protein
MESVPINYLELAEELLQVAQEFAISDGVVSNIYHFGSKSVQVLAKPSCRPDGIDPMNGLIKNFIDDFADYTIIFLDAIATKYTPEIKHFDRHDSPLGQVRTHLTKPYRIALDVHTSTVQVHDPRSAVVVIWCVDVNQYPYWAAATPFRLALAWIADTFDGEMLHGAAIERENKCLILAGRSGAGKSTFTFLAHEHGFRILSDDYFLYESGLMYPVYTRGKLHDASFKFLVPNSLEVLNPHTEGQKRIIHFDSQILRTMCGGVEVKAYLVPQGPEKMSLYKIRAGEVFRHLAPYSSSGLLGGLERSFLRTKRAISDKPAFCMQLMRPKSELMRDLEEIFDEAK